VPFLEGPKELPHLSLSERQGFNLRGKEALSTDPALFTNNGGSRRL